MGLFQHSIRQVNGGLPVSVPYPLSSQVEELGQPK